MVCRPSPARRKSVAVVVQQGVKGGGQPSLHLERAEINALGGKSKHRPVSSAFVVRRLDIGYCSLN